MAKRNLVFGVGVNDSDYQVCIRERVLGVHKKIWSCPIYQAWDGMLKRCYSESFHAKHPTYIGCTVVRDWHSFSAFREWAATQPWEGNQLDKDILSPGNKVYGPDTCVFVPSQLNSFMSDAGAARGRLPIGVCRNVNTEKFQAQCSNPFTGRHEYLGLFSTPSAAHEAWRRRKHQHALRYADQQDDQRISSALRQRFATSKGATE